MRGAAFAEHRAEGRIGGRRKKLDDIKRREIAEAVISGRKTAAQMARMFSVSPPTVSRIVAAHCPDIPGLSVERPGTPDIASGVIGYFISLHADCPRCSESNEGTCTSCGSLASDRGGGHFLAQLRLPAPSAG